MPTLVMKDGESKTVGANVVPEKGANKYAIKKLTQELIMLGYNRITLKSDDENSIKALKRAVNTELAHFGVETMMEESHPGEHQSNGQIEGAVKIWRGQFKTIKDATEKIWASGLRQRTMRCRGW